MCSRKYLKWCNFCGRKRIYCTGIPLDKKGLKNKRLYYCSNCEKYLMKKTQDHRDGFVEVENGRP